MGNTRRTNNKLVYNVYKGREKNVTYFGQLQCRYSCWADVVDLAKLKTMEAVSRTSIQLDRLRLRLVRWNTNTSSKTGLRDGRQHWWG